MLKRFMLQRAAEDEAASAPLLVPEMAAPAARPADTTPGREMPAPGPRALRRNSSFGFRPGSGAGSFTAANTLARSLSRAVSPSSFKSLWVLKSDILQSRSSSGVLQGAIVCVLTLSS